MWRCENEKLVKFCSHFKIIKPATSNWHPATVLTND